MNWLFTVGWIALVIAGLALETVALVRKQRGDTASEHIWWLLRRSPVIWFLALGLFAWMIVHFFLFGLFDRLWW